MPPSPTKSKSRKQSHGQLDMALFARASLRNEAASEHARSIFERQLQNSTEDMRVVLRNILNPPDLFEYLVSTMNDHAFDDLLRRLMNTFPNKAHQFSSSFVADLLLRFVDYYQSLRLSVSGLQGHRRTAELVPKVFEAMSMTVFPDCVDTRSDRNPRGRKKSWRTRAPSVDQAPFDRLQLKVPETRAEADSMKEKLLADLREAFKFYMSHLRDSELADRIKKAYLGDEEDDVVVETEAKVVEIAAEQPTINQHVPAAYPFVQPLKAAFHFDSVKGFGEWRILMSSRIDGNLREYNKKNKKLFHIVLKKIRELSNGHFSDDNQKRLSGTELDIPVFEAKMTGDTRLVYAIDCVKEYDSEVERQVLRLFGVYTHAQLNKHFWDYVSRHLAGGGKEYRKRCLLRRTPLHKGDKNVPPQIFAPRQEDPVELTSPTLATLSNEDKEELHTLLVLEKFTFFSQAHLNSILADQDAFHVFHMSPAEQEIVRHMGSCYVLGRSGTGKTTTMLFKMLGIERAWDTMRSELGEGFSYKPRQLFVTQSRVLAEKVEEYYTKLNETHLASQRTAEASTALATAKNDRRTQGLVNKDEEEFYHGTLPKRFADLKDEHFPLFLTFDHLCRLLELNEDRDGKSITAVPVDGEGPEQQTESISSSDYMLQKRDSFISYDVFLKSYWPHFPQPLTKGLDPGLVFAETIGIIKGSEQALDTEKGYLDYDAYMSLSGRQGSFASTREVIYTLFQSYLKIKRTRREWDAADRTHTLLRVIREVGIQGSKLDFIYIDEAQDNLLIDAKVLRMLCRNPDGYFWAGDTAQTISAGSAFRFNDLKSFIYRLEAAQNGMAPSEVPPTPTFQLTVNYRSHGGIVRCAHSVVQLITTFWPHAIDHLGEEKGVVDGVKPIFFSGQDQDAARYEQFLFGTAGSQIEFGAKQCILVRDDSARDKLRDMVGDIGLVLTIYESKGLEFDDVLLYDFFEDSHVEASQWRVILNALPDSGIMVKCPQYDETKHSGVCGELKRLYVAITRARKNLWIADCSERAQPLKLYWKALELIHECSPLDNVPRLATTSTLEEWGETAQDLFHHQRYLQAMRCYERAGMDRERDIAHAYFLREQARRLPVTRSLDSTRVAAYTDAAEAFQKSARASSKEEEITAYNRIAGDCFAAINNHPQAAAAYRLAKEYTRSAQHYRKAGLFDDAVDVVRTYSDEIPEREAESITTVAKLYYLNQGHLTRAVDLFSTLDEALEFLEDCGFDASRAELLENAGRLAEAAECHLSEGRLIKALDLLLEDSSTPSSRRRAEECLVEGFWQQLSFRLFVNDAYHPGSELGELYAISARMLQKQVLSEKGCDEVAMFRAITDRQYTSLQRLGQKFYENYADTAATILCLDHAFRHGLKIRAMSCIEMSGVLNLFVLYTRELSRIVYEQNPAVIPALQRLFGFNAAQGSNNTILVPAATFLHRHYCENNPKQDSSDDLHLSSLDLQKLLDDAIGSGLHRLVQDENSQCRNAPALSPCSTHAVLRFCNANACMGAHLDAGAMDKTWYIARLRVLLQQITIYQTIIPMEHRINVEEQQRFWLSRLYHALHPVDQQLGSSTTPDLFLSPEAEKAIPIVREWLRDMFYKLTPWSNESEHFLTTVGELSTLAFYFDRPAAQSYIERAPCVAVVRPLALLREDRRYLVHDLIDCLEGRSTTSISSGILLLKSIDRYEVRLDVNVLCHLVDRISSSLVIFWRLWKFGSIHDTTLMRTWIHQLSGDTELRDTRLVLLFLNSIEELLREVYSGRAGYLLFERTYRISFQQRNIFVARLLRSLVLLGYNIPDTQMRWRIVQIVISLRKPGSNYPRILVNYIMASRWEDLVRALRASASPFRCNFDELVQVKDRRRCKGPIRPLKNTRMVVYDDVNDIPSLLRAESRNSPASEAVSPQVVQFSQPSAEVAIENHEGQVDKAEESEEDDEPSSPEEEDTLLDHNVDLEAAARSAAHVYEAPAAHTAEEITAARLIAKAYKYSLARRRGAPKKGLAEARARWYNNCRQRSQDMHTSYRCLYLGPLPHALVCLEDVVDYAGKAKKSARERLRTVQHEEYERVNEELGRAMKVSKEAIRLKKSLEPEAELHAKQDQRLLKARISELESLVLGTSISERLRLDLEIAVKGIVAEKKPPKKLKPMLVDLD